MMVLDEKSEYHQINYCVEDRYVHFKFHVNLSKKRKKFYRISENFDLLGMLQKKAWDHLSP